MSKNKMITCKHCGAEIAAGAKVCPRCGGKNSKPIYKRPWFIALAVLIVLGAAAGSGGKKETGTASQQAAAQSPNGAGQTQAGAAQAGAVTPVVEVTEPVTVAETEPEYLAITSTDLIGAYNENQVKCKQLYDGQYLEVTGPVQSVGTDVLNQTYVCLGSETEYTIVGIQCYTKNENTINQISELKEGDVITVRGVGSCDSLRFGLNKIEIMQ